MMRYLKVNVRLFFNAFFFCFSKSKQSNPSKYPMILPWSWCHIMANDLLNIVQDGTFLYTNADIGKNRTNTRTLWTETWNYEVCSQQYNGITNITKTCSSSNNSIVFCLMPFLHLWKFVFFFVILIQLKEIFHLWPANNNYIHFI